MSERNRLLSAAYEQETPPRNRLLELRAYQPTMRDRLAAWLMGDERASVEKSRFVEGLLGSRGQGTTGVGLADVTPLGIPMGIQDAMRGDEPTRDSLLAIFGGPMARTADRTALAAAQKLKAAGAPRERIWKETGWFEGADGKWKFEIDDSKSKYTGFLYDKNTALENVLSHKPLFDAYPDIKRTPTEAGVMLTGGYYDPAAPRGTPNLSFTGPTDEKVRSIGLHELQHLIQDKEAFAPGGTTQLVRNLVGDKIDRNLMSDDVVHEAYRRMAGEVESRAVQKRADMTPEQRRARAPWLDYDVPEDQQIVRFK